MSTFSLPSNASDLYPLVRTSFVFPPKHKVDGSCDLLSAQEGEETQTLEVPATVSNAVDIFAITWKVLKMHFDSLSMILFMESWNIILNK